MKKFLVRLERGLVRVLLAPELRVLEHDLAVRLARRLAVRVGLSSAVLGVVLELINRYVV